MIAYAEKVASEYESEPQEERFEILMTSMRSQTQKMFMLSGIMSERNITPMITVKF